MRTLLIAMVICSFSQIVVGQKYIGKDKDIQQILKNIQKFSEHVMASDYEMISQSYTEDGKIFPNNREIIEGRTDVKGYWVLPEGMSISYHKITPVEIKIKGKEAYDYGYYEGTTKRENGEETSWKGKYVIVWKKVGKDWKMYLDIWNSIKS